jgi:hypothetical protein
MHCSSTKDIWDKLQNVYEGDTKFKETKLQTYRGQFEQLKMKEDENIVIYYLRVYEKMNAIKGLGEEVDESTIAQKLLRSIPMRFDPNISALEERTNMDSISMDELHGILTTYEIRTKKENLKKLHSKNPRSQTKRERKRKSQIIVTMISQKTMKK